MKRRRPLRALTSDAAMRREIARLIAALDRVRER
jgi:hypothetical protein